MSSESFRPSVRQRLGEGDIARLAALVAATQQEDQGLAAPREINTVARTVIDPQFVDPPANELRIPKQSDLNPRNAALDRLDSDQVAQGVEPVSKIFGLTDFDHEQS
jgi:hypothetical protein